MADRADEISRCEKVFALNEPDAYSQRIAEALDLMQGFMSSPVGDNPERDDKIRRVWQNAPLEDAAVVTRARHSSR